MLVLRLKGMEMPKSCGGCGLPLDLCDKWKTRNWGAQRPTDCPLVEIPAHGRLIDVDAPLRFEVTVDAKMNHATVDIIAPSVMEADWSET